MCFIRSWNRQHFVVSKSHFKITNYISPMQTFCRSSHTQPYAKHTWDICVCWLLSTRHPFHTCVCTWTFLSPNPKWYSHFEFKMKSFHLPTFAVSLHALLNAHRPSMTGGVTCLNSKFWFGFQLWMVKSVDLLLRPADTNLVRRV